MNKTDKILLISMFVAIGISFISFIIFFFIIRRVKNKYSFGNTNQAVRKNAGEINDDVKDKLGISMKPQQVEFLINNIFINQYENILIFGQNCEYYGFTIAKQLKWTKIFHNKVDEENLNKIKNLGYEYNYKMAGLNQTFDAILWINDEDINNYLENLYEKLNANGMIIINVNPLNNYSRTILSDQIKKFGYLYEFSADRKFILIVKKINK
ncbi:Uncharacterised protein [Mycoplasmopsis californica]|uniref:Uncharacterized protein n=1 Tax=Mycoplasmopsis equigenitalium TaxID=114883 RepID=A0ABY5J209_9BACT|nr:hypothetical protein [Mycoplasmopsis equigenitalium]UUD37276.1 hypothetical protein NPA09_01750 [Mycoplasmopsis equigenitalium]VEU69415.1 Uncharacterised protein [Mycoplasmopsis californica]